MKKVSVIKYMICEQNISSNICNELSDIEKAQSYLKSLAERTKERKHITIIKTTKNSLVTSLYGRCVVFIVSKLNPNALTNMEKVKEIQRNFFNS